MLLILVCLENQENNICGLGDSSCLQRCSTPRVIDECLEKICNVSGSHLTAAWLRIGRVSHLHSDSSFLPLFLCTCSAILLLLIVVRNEVSLIKYILQLPLKIDIRKMK